MYGGKSGNGEEENSNTLTDIRELASLVVSFPGKLGQFDEPVAKILRRGRLTTRRLQFFVERETEAGEGKGEGKGVRLVADTITRRAGYSSLARSTQEFPW